MYIENIYGVKLRETKFSSSGISSSIIIVGTFVKSIPRWLQYLLIAVRQLGNVLKRAII